MIKKFLILAVFLSLTTSAYAQDTPVDSIEPQEKETIESAMNLLKDIQEKHVRKENLLTFLDKPNISNPVKQLVVSYTDQGLSYANFEKQGYGTYRLLPSRSSLQGAPASVSEVHLNSKCAKVFLGNDFCYSSWGSVCVFISGTRFTNDYCN